MPRVKRGVTARAHKKVLVQAKGYRGRRKNVYRIAKQAVMKAGQYAYRDRRQRKRQFRSCGSPVSTRLPARTGHEVQHPHEWPEEGADRSRPQGAGRSGRFRQGCVCGIWRTRPRPARRLSEAKRGRGAP